MAAMTIKYKFDSAEEQTDDVDVAPRRGYFLNAVKAVCEKVGTVGIVFNNTTGTMQCMLTEELLTVIFLHFCLSGLHNLLPDMALLDVQRAGSPAQGAKGDVKEAHGWHHHPRHEAPAFPAQPDKRVCIIHFVPVNCTLAGQ